MELNAIRPQDMVSVDTLSLPGASIIIYNNWPRVPTGTPGFIARYCQIQDPYKEGGVPMKVEVIEWNRMCVGTQWTGASTGAFAGTSVLAPSEWDESAKGSFFGPVPDLAAAEESSSHATASGGAAFAVGGDGWSLAELAVYCDRDGVCGIALRVRLADTLVVHGIRSA